MNKNASKAYAKANKLRDRLSKDDGSDPGLTNNILRDLNRHQHTGDTFNAASSLSKDLMNKTLKELNMGKAEQEYRAAVKNYMDYVSGKDLSIPMQAITSGYAAQLVRMGSKKGRKLKRNIDETKYDYLNEN